MMADSNIIAITMGCPVGVGPEIIVKFLSASPPPAGDPLVVFGDPAVISSVASQLDIDITMHEWHPGQSPRTGALNVCPVAKLTDSSLTLDPALLHWGKPNVQTGKAMAAYIAYAQQLAEQGEVSAIVTCPIAKSTLNLAGYDYPGHTEMLADLCRAKEFAMMMAGDTLRVTLVTIHQSLAEVAASLTVDKIVRLINLTGTSLRSFFAIPQPRIAVAGFNPHAGEGGLFGCEEQDVIAPAIEQARALGWQVSGPFPPDTVFCQAAAGKYDVVVCMYHDQGLIPFKLLHFADGVNVTLGLPIVRTSVDHGTAYDIAGQGIASDESLAAACQMAGEIVRNRKKVVS